MLACSHALESSDEGDNEGLVMLVLIASAIGTGGNQIAFGRTQPARVMASPPLRTTQLWAVRRLLLVAPGNVPRTDILRCLLSLVRMAMYLKRDYEKPSIDFETKERRTTSKERTDDDANGQWLNLVRSFRWRFIRNDERLWMRLSRPQHTFEIQNEGLWRLFEGLEGVQKK